MAERIDADHPSRRRSVQSVPGVVKHGNGITGFTTRDYADRFKEQNGVCAICLRPPKPERILDADHDHNSGKKRGLLCHDCNVLVGQIENRIGLGGARRLFEYLLKYA